MEEAGDHEERWYRRLKDRGLRVKLALDEDGKVGGMVEYLPIEHSYAEGSDLNFVSCICIHGYKQGRGGFRKKGMGKRCWPPRKRQPRSGHRRSSMTRWFSGL